MASREQDERSWKLRNRPYVYAIVLAMIMTMFIAPEVQEGTSMAPTIEKGTVVVLSKGTFSVKRGIPEIGSVVVLAKNAAPTLSDDNIIARVVGLPGETVTIKNGTLYRDNKAFEVPAAQGDLGKDLTVKLGASQVFLLCDNRDKQVDSRSGKLGPVDMKEIRGIVRLKVWPISQIGGIE